MKQTKTEREEDKNILPHKIKFLIKFDFQRKITEGLKKHRTRVCLNHLNCWQLKSNPYLQVRDHLAQTAWLLEQGY